MDETQSKGEEGVSSELAKCEAARDEYLNGWKRAKADLMNYQRDEAKRSEELMRWSAFDLMKNLVPVLDSFDLALRVSGGKGEADPNVAGMVRIRAQLEDVLKRKGLEQIVVLPGTPFDPNVHEAVGEVASESPPGTVAEEVERGYALHGKVVRPARVLLSREKEPV